MTFILPFPSFMCNLTTLKKKMVKGLTLFPDFNIVLNMWQKYNKKSECDGINVRINKLHILIRN